MTKSTRAAVIMLECHAHLKDVILVHVRETRKCGLLGFEKERRDTTNEAV